MKNVHMLMRDAVTRVGLALMIGTSVLAAGAAATAVDDRAAVVDALDLETVLESSRTAANRSAWSALPHGVFLEGTTDAGGVDAGFKLFLTADGRYRYEMDGRLARMLTFDGETVALRVRSGPTVVEELGNRENRHFAQWVHSGYWLDPSCPLSIELADETPEDVTLRLSFADSPTSARLVLDRETWLPHELWFLSIGGEAVVRFLQYEDVAGIPISRHVQSEAQGESNELRVLDGRMASADLGSRFERSTALPTDVTFDPDVSPDIEVKRVISGHLLVHPIVDGLDVGWFILDSGAGQICIDPKVADELGFDSFGSLPAVGVAGRVPASFRQGSSLQLGPMRLADPQFVELDLAFLAPIFGVEVAGICGYDIFARAVVELDLQEPSVAIHDPATFDLGDDAWSRLAIEHRGPAIPCRFEGDREGFFKIDLGDSGTITFYSSTVESLDLLNGRDVTPSQVGGVGGSGKASAGTLEWFEVGGHRTESLPTTFSQTEVGVFSDSYLMGNLGTTMLKPFHVVLDYPNSRIALVPRG